LCDEFFINPSINPITGRSIQFGKKTYNDLVKVCEKYSSNRYPRSPSMSNQTLLNVMRPLSPSIQELGFTGLPEIDRQILVNLDIDSINNASLTNVYIHNLLNNEFWRERLERKYNVITIDSNKNYKHLNYQLNDPIRYYEMFVDAIKNGDLFLVELILNNELIDISWYQTKAPQWIRRNDPTRVYKTPLKLALETNNKNMVKLLLSYYDENDEFDAYTKNYLHYMFANTPDYQMILDLPQMKNFDSSRLLPLIRHN